MPKHRRRAGFTVAASALVAFTLLGCKKATLPNAISRAEAQRMAVEAPEDSRNVIFGGRYILLAVVMKPEPDYLRIELAWKAIGGPDCSVPTCGLNWLKTFPPIVLERWPVATRIEHDALTTIGNWRGYGCIKHQGVIYGQKAHSLRRFFELPTMTNEKFMLALAIHPNETTDQAALAQNGWRLLDPARVANTPASYQQFIQGSKAEFGIAKSGYVASQCGWFSDRSVCYLASGRPVIAQETGFSRYVPTGEGLFAFNTSGEVLKAIESLRAHYPKHAAAARAVAEQYFDSNKVLRQLLEQVGV